MATTQIAVRLPDELLAAVDALVDRGDAENRADAVRTALERHVAAIERRRIDAAIVEGYERFPIDAPDAWGDLAAWADAATNAMMRELDRQERAAGFEPW